MREFNSLNNKIVQLVCTTLILPSSLNNLTRVKTFEKNVRADKNGNKGDVL